MLIQNQQHYNNNPRNNKTPTMNTMVVKNGQLPKNSKIECVYCNEHHYSASCEKIVSLEARKKVLGDAGRCFNCLRKGHNAKDCTNKRKCRHCQGKHHQSICAQNKKVEDPLPTEEKEKPETED